MQDLKRHYVLPLPHSAETGEGLTQTWVWVLLNQTPVIERPQATQRGMMVESCVVREPMMTGNALRPPGIPASCQNRTATGPGSM
jgi:hypothetical protein